MGSGDSDELINRVLQEWILNAQSPFPRGFDPLSYDPAARRDLIHAAFVVYPADAPISASLLTAQDALLRFENLGRGIIDVDQLPPVNAGRHPGVCLWRGDIRRVQADAIVNAANDQLLGCFQPTHVCIDNIIHSAAGFRLRQACLGLPRPCETGRAYITPAFNLPARHVLHVVGPIVSGKVTAAHEASLAACYSSCLDVAAAAGLRSVAFCCISTGLFGYPQEPAAKVAIRVVDGWLGANSQSSVRRVVFVPFREDDAEIYERQLSQAR